MKTAKVIALVIVLAAAWAGGYGYGRWYGPGASRLAQGSGNQQASGYYCPMHPKYRSPEPGNCGICGMRLVADKPATAAGAPAAGRILHYRDPQDPGYTSANPGVNPATGNDLEPVYEDSSEQLPPGTIHVSPDKQQWIGVRYAVVERESAARSIRAPGTVVVDERRVAKVQSRVEGWIETVLVDFTGKAVRAGQPLLTLYSPEMLASQQEYLLAIRSREILRGSSLRGSLDHAERLLAAARKRLELFELGAAQLEQLESTGQPIPHITVYSPATGFVLTRNAFPRQRVTADSELYTIADLSRVWIMADVFESDAALIRQGMPARVALSYAGGRVIHASVDYIQPSVDPMTRTLKVRLEAANPGFALKPGMFVDVDFSITLPPRLMVPVEAVLDSGMRKTVFVDRGNGHLEPRQVETGETAGGRVAIRQGLRAGERIVVSGNFLIDSESQFQAAASGMAIAEPSRPVPAAPGADGGARQGQTAMEAPRGGRQHD